MKKFISILCTFLFLTGIISILTACNIKTDSSEPEAKQYSVRFYNDTELVSTVQTSGNETIETPNLTAPEHFTFGGWFLDKDVWQQGFSGKEYEQKPLTSDLDVYAKWTQTEFQIQFETNGGTPVESSGSWTGKIESEPASTREHFRFDGEYFSDADMTVPFDDFKADTNKTVYMKIWYVGFDYSKVIFTIEEALDSDKPILYAKIPSQIDGSPVYFLSSSFQNNFRFKRNLKEVVVEPGIRTIANSAFYYSDQLEKVTLPDGIMLAGGVFSSCPKLSEVICDGTIRSSSTNFYNTALYKNEDNWENGALYIGNYLADFDETKITTSTFKVKEGTVSISGSAFSYRSDAPVQVTSVDFGNTVKYIGSWAFDRAKSITSFTGMDAVESIGADAFRDTGYFSKTSNWTGNLLYLNHWLIASDSFSGALTLQAGTVGIADKVFSGNKNITSVDFGNSLAYIGKYAFGTDYSPSGGILTDIVFPASLRSIDDYAFSYQTKLTNVRFEEGLEYIGDSAFRSCNAVEYMIIPASVKTICRSGLQIAQTAKLYLRGALKDIYAENEWNGYSFSTLKPTPYYEYSETQKSGYWHFNSDGLPEIWN